jgi:hypothetical protein
MEVLGADDDDDGFVIDTRAEELWEEEGGQGGWGLRVLTALDVAFVAAERAVMTAGPEIVDRGGLAARRVRGVIEGPRGREGWELMGAFEESMERAARRG